LTGLQDETIIMLILFILSKEQWWHRFNTSGSWVFAWQ